MAEVPLEHAGRWVQEKGQHHAERLDEVERPLGAPSEAPDVTQWHDPLLDGGWHLYRLDDCLAHG
jgi:hypothetical protein